MPDEHRVIDLFAGPSPGGWDLAAHRLGMEPLGIEWDDAACATRQAADLWTLQADVAALEPRETVADYFPGEARIRPRSLIDGMIASPPCQSFSMAGKRGGEQDTEHVIACAMELAAGSDTRAEHRAKCVDERSMLVVEPIRWVRDLRPRWVALEQVPPVLSLWSLFAGLLEQWGYRSWTGVLSAERYGVPQTRKRAILLASLDHQPHPPVATHQAYVPGEPQRHEVTMLGEVLPWISMAQALGWREGERAYKLARGEGISERHGDRPPTPDGVPAPVVSGKARTASWVRTNNFTAHTRNPDGSRTREGSSPYERPTDEPSPTVVGRIDLWKLRAGTNANDVERPADAPAPTMRFGERSNDVSWVMRSDAQEKAAVRSVDEPEPTITGGHATGERVWQPTHLDQRPSQKVKDRGGDPEQVGKRSVEAPAPTLGAQGLAEGRDVWLKTRGDRDDRYQAGAGNQPRPIDAPAVTVDTGLRQAEWTTERPAPTVVGGRRSSEGIIVGRQLPAGEDRSVGGWSDVEEAPAKDGNAVRVTVQEASILQSFPPDYPWQGSRSAQFQCIGNAVPPLMAFHILKALVAPEGIASRFWPKVRIGLMGDCWEWQAAKNEHSYGVLHADGKHASTLKAHRVAWEIANGPIPDGAVICHRCDNPSCVNAGHLFLGTQADNVADMHAKGRGNVGSVNGQAKLTETQVREIRERVAAGETQKALCEEFGIAKGPMSSLVNGKTWKHVSDEAQEASAA